VVNTLLRGFVSPTSAHLLPQALRFSQSNVQHCYYCASQREHTRLSSVIMNVPFGATHTGSTGPPSVAATKTSTTVSKTNHIAGAKASSNLYQSDRTSVRGSRFGQPKNAQAVAFSTPGTNPPRVNSACISALSGKTVGRMISSKKRRINRILRSKSLACCCCR
jgi:hypothetical protein